MALLVEIWNPLSETKIENDSAADLPEELKQTTFYLETKHRVAVFGGATAEVAGLAPTLVSSVTSGFAVIGDLEDPFGPAVIYVIIFLSVTIFVIRLLSGVTLYNIGSERIESIFLRARPIQNAGPNHKHLTRQEVVKRTIIGSNVFLILATLGVFLFEVTSWPASWLHELICCLTYRGPSR